MAGKLKAPNRNASKGSGGTGGSKLPKAPLVEVVFEVRWEIAPSDPEVISPAVDPALLPLLYQFTEKVKKLGFVFSRELGHPTLSAPHSIVRRYFLSEEAPFPLLQVGPGVFASNQGVDYEWERFRSQSLKGLALILDSIPILEGVAFKPIELELRYIDVFDERDAKSSGFYNFLNELTTVTVGIPDFGSIENNQMRAIDGRLVAKWKVNRPLGGTFSFDIGSAKKGSAAPSDRFVRLESKVISSGAGVPKFVRSNKATFLKKIGAWLDQSHDLTSSFFRKFVKPGLMEKFKE